MGLIVSVGGGFLAWMLLAAESLFTPAGGGVMPAWMGQSNAKGVPAHALWLTNGMVQLFLLVALWSKASYLALISLSTAMILIPYLFSACYGLKLAWVLKQLRPELDLYFLAAVLIDHVPSPENIHSTPNMMRRSVRWFLRLEIAG